MTTASPMRGIIPAHLLPFNTDYSINFEELSRHLEWLVGVDGVTGIASNGHAGEVSSLTRDEQRQVLEFVLETVNGRVPIMAGVFSDSTLEAVRLAKDAQQAGAQSILVLPPFSIQDGYRLRPEMAINHYKAIADAVGDMPLVCFQFLKHIGLFFSKETIARLLEEVPTIVAIKDASMDMIAYEETYRAARSCGRYISMLSSISPSLLATLAIGADGILSGNGSVIADLQADLFAAVEEGDLAKARAINDRIFPLTQAFYGAPLVDNHNRMKEALVMLGRQERAVVRPPLTRIADSDRERVRHALIAAKLLDA